jgi:CDP-diglyceride synthetase
MNERVKEFFSILRYGFKYLMLAIISYVIILGRELLRLNKEEVANQPILLWTFGVVMIALIGFFIYIIFTKEHLNAYYLIACLLLIPSIFVSNFEIINRLLIMSAVMFAVGYVIKFIEIFFDIYIEEEIDLLLKKIFGRKK